MGRISSFHPGNLCQCLSSSCPRMLVHTYRVHLLEKIKSHETQRFRCETEHRSHSTASASEWHKSQKCLFIAFTGCYVLIDTVHEQVWIYSYRTVHYFVSRTDCLLVRWWFRTPYIAILRDKILSTNCLGFAILWFGCTYKVIASRMVCRMCPGDTRIRRSSYIPTIYCSAAPEHPIESMPPERT